MAPLRHVAADRGSLPSVVHMDNGAENKNAAVHVLSEERRVIALRSEPRTPEHDARAEHGIGALEQASGLDEPAERGAVSTRPPVLHREPGPPANEQAATKALARSLAHAGEHAARRAPTG
jgi:hypothetical protein